ncbi:MAG: chemotaxis protein CheX [Firmicutes bacterium]|nr:chemotaxis protein CheX [Bacillota bacterium]
MKAEYVNSFYQAAQDVFKIMLDVGTQKDDVFTHEITDDGANITIKLKGDLTGTIVFSFPKETALEMVKIMSGMEMDKLDSFILSALSEIVNIICGNAATHLQKYNKSVDITPPEVVEKPSTEADKCELLPLKTDIGAVKLNIQLEENQE